ncbi:MAG: sugar ABC transporter permease [Epulopiscium sp.]|nr:sugar ABC transporter permease [Candidatus Epulonipiscium sp.]
MKNSKIKNTWKYLKKSWILYLFVLPPIIYLLIFDYVPLYGIQIAFKNFRPAQGIWGSKWVGFAHFKTFFESYHFWSLLKNTLILSLYSLIAGFPIPIILALLLNHCRFPKLKKSLQTITYAPHFISTVVFCGMIFMFLSVDGIVNHFLGFLGIDPIIFMSKAEYFRHIYVWSGVFKGMGWSSIIYIATLASVSPDLHEAALVDGATKMQRIIHIDLPSIIPTMVILLILNTGQIMNVGFEKAFLLQTPVNLEFSEIISTYVYKKGIQGAQFSYSAAIGLFNNITNFILLTLVNAGARKANGNSLW